MVLADFLTETRRKWLQAFKLFKSKNKKNRNRVSPDTPPANDGTVDAHSDIDVNFCHCRTDPPPDYENKSDYNSYNSYNSHNSHQESLRSYNRSVSAHSDSAYDSIHSSPVQSRPVMYATATYLNVNDSEDSCSIHTEYTLLDYDPDADESAQNMINESIELVGAL